ncbi:MAG: hypothetical protein Q4A92_07220 [Corynebacterium sp.]|nr:hypothetical protein [Corynebacterium sp.]
MTNRDQDTAACDLDYCPPSREIKETSFSQHPDGSSKERARPAMQHKPQIHIAVAYPDRFGAIIKLP